MKPHPVRLHTSRRGFALVLSLAIVALLTLVIVAFFSRAVLNRQISVSGSNSARADQMVRSAGDYVLGQLRREMHDGSDVFSDPATDTVFMRPLVPENNLPLLAGIANADTIGQTTIVKVSANPSTAGAGLGKQTIGSSIRISEPSANGRSIGAARWFGKGGPQLGSADLPTWVYLTRSGVDEPTPPAGADPTSSRYVVGRFAYTVYDVSGRLDANIAGYKATIPATNDTRSPLKTWQAYADLTTMGLGATEIGKLAQWRDGAAAVATPDAYYTNLAKGELRGFIGAGQNQNRFVSRHDLIDALGGSGRSTVFGTESLPTTLASSFAHANYCSTTPSWGPTLNSSADPDYSAGAGVTATDYRTLANEDTTANRFVPFVLFGANHSNVRHYKDDGTFDTYNVLNGDRAIQHRFSLRKLAWLGWNGPDAAGFKSSVTTAQREEAIRRCFGLEWDNDGGKWYYTQFDSSVSTITIKTLAQVSDEGREPNFFEMLNAGILNGSVGQHPGEGVPASMYSTAIASVPDKYFKLAVGFDKYSGNKARHILQIGANIIDQYDSDSYPTLIDAVPASMAAGRSERQKSEDLISGVENLPYLSRLHAMQYVDPLVSTPNDPDNQYYKFWWLVELWNPHQQWVDNGGVRPQKFRVRAYGNCYSWVQKQSTPSTRSDTQKINYDTSPFLPSQPTYRDIYFMDVKAGEEGSRFFNQPRVLKRTDAVIPDTAPVNLKPTAGVTYDKFYGTYDTPPTATNYVEFDYAGIFAGETAWHRKWTVDPPAGTLPKPPSNPYNSGFLQVQIQPDPLVTMVVECFDGTRWRQYSSIARAYVTWGGTQSNNVSDWLAGTTDKFDGSLDFQARPAGHAPDPRTDRFSLSKRRAELGAYWPVEKTLWSAGVTAYTIESDFGGDMPDGTMTSFRYLPGVPSMNPQIYDYYTSITTHDVMSNVKPTTFTFSGKNGVYYADPDGVVRPSDGFRMEAGSNTSSTGDGNYLYHFDATQHRVGRVRRRPVVLNRPFESVAELGYVYKDLPGRNLDLWSKSSPDTGLLDLFSLREEPSIIAGKINLNRAGVAEIKAILSGGLKAKVPATTSTGAVDAPLQQISATEADKLAKAIRAQLASNAAEPFGNNAEMTLSLAECINNALDGTSTTEKPFKKNKAWAEAPIRALTQMNQNQTWNLLIDVVAQPGRLRKGATTLGSDYVVEGERRFWIHVSIDRPTGKVISYQLEPVL